MAKKGMKGKVAGKKKRIDVDEQFDAFLKEVSSRNHRVCLHRFYFSLVNDIPYTAGVKIFKVFTSLK